MSVAHRMVLVRACIGPRCKTSIRDNIENTFVWIVFTSHKNEVLQCVRQPIVRVGFGNWKDRLLDQKARSQCIPSMTLPTKAKMSSDHGSRYIGNDDSQL